MNEDRFKIWKSVNRTHISWMSMRSRCLNSKNLRYKDYGGREIIVCRRWRDFKTFLLDMGEKPEGLSLERKDNDKGYSPDNCKWATPMEQSNNTRRNKLFIAYGPDGQEELVKSQSLFAREYNLNPNCICNCLRGSSQAHQGWTFISVPEDFPKYNEILKLFEVKE